MNNQIQWITSARNPQIKDWHALQTGKGRKATGLFTAEGLRLVREITEPWVLRQLVLSDRFYQERPEDWQPVAGRFPEAGITVVPEGLFASLADTKNPQGIMAVVEQRFFTPEDLTGGPEPFVLVLENLQDPGNAGGMLRTMDAAGMSGLLCSRGTVDIYSPKAVRASMGSLFHLPVAYTDDLPGVLAGWSGRGIHLIAAHLEGSRSLYDTDLTGPAAVLIGNEGNGLTPQITALCRDRVRIPQPGRAESLNALTAAAIIIYETLRQRTGGR
ncbi:MAG: RNA methyltransferase [Firmicutes bacterium]|nr:RNA methyltransferase [Bacillota bacterium]